MADREFLVSLLGSLGTSLAAAHFLRWPVDMVSAAL